jgi:hypothetical protein
MKRQRTLQEACDLMTDMGLDELSDGAYWAIAHDLAEAEYGEVWHELDSYPKDTNKSKAEK